MLQTNLGGAPVRMSVFNPAVVGCSKQAEVQPAIAPCPMTKQLMDLIGKITGWKVEFDESTTSLQRRKQSVSKTEPAQGTFSIVDMSAQWPAHKPTSHRGKCDQLVAVIDHLVNELQSAQAELARTQSVLVAMDPMAEIDENVLVDSFVPKFGLDSKPVWDSMCSDKATPVTDFDSDFEVHQDDADSAACLVCPPFEGWSLGGATGIHGNYYLDWMVDGDERISICAGEIDRKSRETVILVDPLTSEYRVEQGNDGNETTNDLQVFHLHDSDTGLLSLIDPSSNWRQLMSHQAIVASTSSVLAMRSDAIGPPVSVDRPSTASRLAEMLIRTLNTAGPLLVLKRD